LATSAENQEKNEIYSFLLDISKSETIINKHASLYVLESKRRSNDYDLCKYSLGNKVMKDLITILQKHVEKTLIKDEKPRICRNYLALDSSSQDLKYITRSDVPNFIKVLDMINKDTDFEDCKDISTIEHRNSFAIKIDGSDKLGRLIFFKKNDEVRILKGNIFSWFTGKLEKVEEPLVSFDNNVDCLYIEKLDKIIIYNSEKFETIFKYREFYERHPDRGIKELRGSYVIISNSIEIEKLSKDALKKITKLHKNKKFEQIKKGVIDISFFKKKKTKTPNEILFDVSGKEISIKKKDELLSFLDACNDKITSAIAPINPNVQPVLYMTEEKELYKYQ
jgi:hypothetical protein